MRRAHNIVQQTVKAKEQKTSCERYIELKMENNKFIVRKRMKNERERERVENGL